MTTNTTTAPRYYNCTTCGLEVLVIGTVTRTMVSHMINAGEITVGEARAELDAGFLPADAVEELAGWVLHRADQGDDWKAGDPEVLPCGCRVAYSFAEVEVNCDDAKCAGRRIAHDVEAASI